MKRYNRFTMIEILAVVAIIGILVGILLPAIAVAKDKARKKEAAVKIKNLQIAIKQYKATYSVLPMSDAAATDDINVNSISDKYLQLLNMLTATDKGDNVTHKSNPRRIKFLDTKFDAAGNPVYQDPWGNDFYISLDITYDDQVNSAVVNGYTDNSGNLRSQVAVWSLGKDGVDSTSDAAKENEDNVSSWD
jgi:prepilin-type N-terminal cleavage/methylation domain-containing protein